MSVRRVAALHQGDARTAAGVLADNLINSVSIRECGLGFCCGRESGAHSGECRTARFLRLAQRLAGMLQHHFNAIRKFMHANPQAGCVSIVSIAAGQRRMA